MFKVFDYPSVLLFVASGTEKEVILITHTSSLGEYLKENGQ